MQLIEQVQYKAVLVESGCWQGTSCERLYDELGLIQELNYLKS